MVERQPAPDPRCQTGLVATEHRRRSTAAYRLAWEENLNRLVEVSEGAGDRVVPTCPAWTVADLCEHVACVYEHKTLLLAVGKFPSRADAAAFHEVRQAAPDRLRRAAGELVGALGHFDDDDFAPTFMAENQTVGFWWRRMALETAVHRTDAELAVGARTPIDEALAVDGIDELLWFASAPWANRADRSAWAGQRITVDAGGARWTVTLDPEGLVVAPGGDGSTVVRGGANALLQWVAGRDAPAVTAEGDLAAVELLRAQLEGF